MTELSQASLLWFFFILKTIMTTPITAMIPSHTIVAVFMDYTSPECAVVMMGL